MLTLLGVAVVVGTCIVRFNIETDRERARAQEAILHCRRQSLHTRTSVADRSLPADECGHLEEHYVRRFGPPR